MIDFAKLIFYVAPMYFANSTAMLFGGKTPIDFGAKFIDEKPLFGKGKTIKGTLIGIFCGSLAGAIISILYKNETSLLFANYFLFSVLTSTGAIIGDIVGSFIKRRIGIDSGKEAFILDQLDFIIGGIVFGLVVYSPSVLETALICAATIIIHKVSNWVAYKINLKKVPW
jgi:CDP-2,3-bis-(O-geranylgeranyl)-sn-glycerol synthase